ncbi:MAG: hypothetical protein QM722_06560 [Piscinibacter sp.]
MRDSVEAPSSVSVRSGSAIVMPCVSVSTTVAPLPALTTVSVAAPLTIAAPALPRQSVKLML